MKPSSPAEGGHWHRVSGPRAYRRVGWEQHLAGCIWAGAASHAGFFFFFFTPFPAEASQEIFKIASMAPGALLLEAQKEYEVWHPALLHTCLLPWAAPMQTQHYIQCDGKGMAWTSLWGHGAGVQAAPAVPGSPGLQAPGAHPGRSVPRPTAHLQAVFLCRRRVKRQMST